MPICAIYNCSSGFKQGSGVRLFGLPSVIEHSCDKSKELSTKRRALWLARINRQFGNRVLNNRNIKVCNKHFLNGSPSALFDPSNPDWAPSLNLGYGKSEESTAQIYRSDRRYARNKARQSKRNTVNKPTTSCRRDIEHLDMMDTQSEGTTQSTEDVFQRNDCEELEEPAGSVAGVKSEVTDSEEMEQYPGSVEEVKFNDLLCDCNTASIRNVFKHEVESVVESADFACQTDLPVQEDIDFQAKYNELLSQNGQLMERMKLLESQLGTVTFEKATIESERDSFRLDNNHLRREVSELKSQTISEKNFENDNEKTKFFTGLPSYDLLKIVYDLTENQVAHTRRNSMPKFTEFLMTMMRLRLGCLEQDLAYRFHVAQSTVSAVCSKWITAMATVLSKFIIWPERSVLRRTIPSCFSAVHGDKVAVIVVCFELFIGRPSSLEPRATVKHDNTVKFLTGITPQGTISFVSNGYGGGCTNKFVTLESGILDHLVPGDIILADRGFDIADDVALHRQNTGIPAFTKEQLSFNYVHKTREIADVRIHVERTIDNIKRKFRILNGSTTNHSFLSSRSESGHVVNDIVKICCALANMCSPIAPDESDSAPPGSENTVVHFLFE